MTMLPGRRNQRGDATDQLQRREDDLGAPVRTRFGQAEDQPLRVEFLQPVGSEGGTGAVAQQAFQALAVVGCEAHARIQREPAALGPPFHLLAGLCVDPSTAHECSEDAAAHLRLHDPHRIGVDGLRRDETDTLLRVGLEHAVDHDDMEVRVLIQRRTEPVDEGHRPGAYLGTGTQAAAQVVLDRYLAPSVNARAG